MRLGAVHELNNDARGCLDATRKTIESENYNSQNICVFSVCCSWLLWTPPNDEL